MLPPFTYRSVQIGLFYIHQSENQLFFNATFVWHTVQTVRQKNLTKRVCVSSSGNERTPGWLPYVHRAMCKGGVNRIALNIKPGLNPALYIKHLLETCERFVGMDQQRIITCLCGSLQLYLHLSAHCFWFYSPGLLCFHSVSQLSWAQFVVTAGRSFSAKQ